jgi:small basic protein
MGWLPAIAGIAGFLLIYYSKMVIPIDYGAYLSIAALAGLDSVIGGARAAQTGKFKRRIFISGFLTAVLVAVVLTWFGERLGVQIFLAVGFVFVYRIMQNLSIIRWYLLDDENPQLRVFNAWRNSRSSESEKDGIVAAAGAERETPADTEPSIVT